MTANWRCVPYSEVDVDGVVALSQAQPGKAAAITAEYVRWQYSANPAGMAQVALAKKSGSDRIVGVLWLIPLRIQVGEEVVLGSHTTYALVHPDYRRQGVFTAMIDHCRRYGQEAGCQFTYGLPAPTSYPILVYRIGWQDVGQARLYLRPLNTSRLIRRRLGNGPIQGALATSGRAGERLLFRPRPVELQAARISVEEADTSDPALDDFWRRIRSKYPVMVVRDTRFLDWRYRQVPGRRYRVWAAWQDRQIVATIVLRSATVEGIACGMVTDFLVEPTEQGRLAGEVLLRHAVVQFRKEDLDLTGCLMLPHAEETELLRRQGYILCPRWLLPRPFPVLVAMYDGARQTETLQKLGCWFLTMGDSDAV